MYNIYSDPGTYFVTLIASNSNGCSDTLNYPDSLYVPGPQLSFSVNQLIGCDSLLVQVSDQSLYTVNYSFDLVRLATTIYERVEHIRGVSKMLHKWMTDDYGENITRLDDDFSLYVHISHHCHNARPAKVIQNKFFEQFTINKLPMPGLADLNQHTLLLKI